MYRVAETLDDLLLKLYPALLKSRKRVATSRGDTIEVTGAMLKLSNPRARLSRSGSRGVLFSCIGELIWYLSGSGRLSGIEPYIKRYKDEVESDGRIHGAYGPRFFNWKSINQIENITKALRANPSTRRAVIQLFDPLDINGTRKKDVPCTCSIQFLIRKKVLEVVVYMRSNDACFGLPHDIFSFTMIQEIVARDLGIEVGSYIHTVGSLHLYEEQLQSVEAFIHEGWQQNMPMPPMPIGSPWAEIKSLINQEKRIRSGNGKENLEKLAFYWRDLAILLKIFLSDASISRSLTKKLHSRTYDSFINRRRVRVEGPQNGQMNLPGYEKIK